MALYDIARGLQPLDLGRTLGQIDQMQASRAQMDAMRTQQEQEKALGAALPGALAGLTSADPAQRQTSLLALAQAGGTRGLALGLPLVQQAQQPGQTRTRVDGQNEVQEEFDRASGQWREIGRGPRWNPRQMQIGGGGGAAAAPDTVQRLYTASQAARAQGNAELADLLMSRARALSGQPDPTPAQQGNIYMSAQRQAYSEANTRQFNSPEERDAFIEGRTRQLLEGARIPPGAPVMQPPVPGAPAPPVAEQPAPMQGLEVVPPPERAPRAAAPVVPPGQIAGPAPGMTAEPPPAAPRGQPALRERANPEVAKLNDAAAEVAAIKAALETFRERFRSASLVERGQAAAGQPTGLSTAWSNAALLAKGEALYNLGVLNGPDLQIIQRTLTAPDTLRGLFTGSSVVDDQVKQIVQLMEDRLAAKARGLNVPVPRAPASSAPPAAPANPMGLRLPGAR